MDVKNLKSIKKEERVKRETLFVRIKQENKNFITSETYRLGFISEREYIDALFDQIRKDQEREAG